MSRWTRPWLSLAATLALAPGTTLAQVYLVEGSAPYFGFDLGDELDGVLHFVASGPSQHALWRSDGTTAGTFELVRFYDQQMTGYIGAPTRVGSTLFFRGFDGPYSWSLWRSDGTAGGTTRVGGLNPWNLAEHDGLLYFNGSEQWQWPDYEQELWVSDGTSGGTTKVVDLASGRESSDPTTPQSILGKLYFSAIVDGIGRELVISDGTAAGTVAVDTVPGPSSSAPGPGYFTELGGTVYFMSDGDLWRTDGTVQGTAKVADLCAPSCDWRMRGSILGTAGGLILLEADDGASGLELWRSDGTAAGTFRIEDIEPGAAGSEPRPIALLGNRLLFSSWTSMTGRELWTSDGTAAGTRIVADINPGPPDGAVGPSIAVNGRVYFFADDGATGTEIWTSDGTAAGTFLVDDIDPGGGDAGANIRGFQRAGTRLFFTMGYPGSMAGDELWALSLTCPAMTLAPAALPDGSIGVPYSASLSAAGGTPPYTFAASTTPPGISLSPAGVLSGAPTAGGVHEFTVTASDSAGCALSHRYRITVPCGISISPATLPSGALGVAYSQTLVATGGSPPHSLFVTAGQLPLGITLSSGTLSGTPSTVAGTFGFTVTARDATRCLESQEYALTITGAGGVAEDVVAGRGLGAPNPNEVKVYRQDGSPTPVGFLAYSAGAWGVNVAAGAIRTGTLEQILTGPGPGPAFGPQVRAFDELGLPLPKVSFYAYGTLKFGTNAATGELEGDGFDEILSGAGPGAVFGPHVRGWNFDGTAVTAIARMSFFAYGTIMYGTNVSCGDVDGDGMSEVLTAPGPGRLFAPQIRGFDHDGGVTSPIAKINFASFGVTGYGASVAAGDVEADGFDEILSGPGPGPGYPYSIAGFDYDGSQVAAAPGLAETLPGTTFGARVGAGDVTGEGRSSVTTGAGWDPTAPSIIRPFRYVSAGGGGDLVPLLAFGAFAPSTYGVSASGGSLGY